MSKQKSKRTKSAGASRRTKDGHKLLHVRGSRYWYVEGFDCDGKQYRNSTKQTDFEAASQAARRIVLENSVPLVQPYALSQAFVELIEYKVLSKMSAATLAIAKDKAARVLEFFEPERPFDIDNFAKQSGPLLIESYVKSRRSDQVNPGYKTQRAVSDATIGKELSNLFQALKRAKKNGHYRGDVEALHTKVLEASEPKTANLTEAQFELLWQELTPKGNEQGTKALWVEQWPSTMSAAEVVKRAHAAGIELTRSHVYTVRYDMRKRAKSKTSTKPRVPEDRRDYLLVYCSTGARYSELGRIEATHIDHDVKNGGANPRVYIIGRKGKKEHRRRWVPLSPQAYEELSARARLVPKGPLFSPWNNSAMNKMLKRLCDRLGIPRCSANDLRRTFVTWHGKHGTPEIETKKFMGHSPASRMVDAVYRQLHDESGRVASDNFPRPRKRGAIKEDNVIRLPLKQSPA